jgi:Protein of unknown function (DUF3348)
MPTGPRRTPATPASLRPPAAPASSPLVRQLSRLAGAEAPASRQALAERLAPWLGLTDAIALAGALSAASAAHLPAQAAPPAAALAAEAARLRRRLADGLAAAPAAAHRRGAAPRPEDAADFTPHRRRYHERQQTLDMAIGPLRARLRDALAAGSPTQVRLAAVDAVMEQALAERERGLLSVVPVLLEKRFEQLRQAAAAATPEPPAATAGWLATFRRDMHQLLLAELDHRWQPLDALLAALPHTP